MFAVSNLYAVQCTVVFVTFRRKELLIYRCGLSPEASHSSWVGTALSAYCQPVSAVSGPLDVSSALYCLQDCVCKSGGWYSAWLGVGCFHNAENAKTESRVLGLDQCHCQQWLINSLSICCSFCANYDSMDRGKMEETTAEDHIWLGERTLHHKTG